MTTTPPPPTAEAPAGPPPADQGPRVTRDEVRDLGRIRRTVGRDRKLAGVAGGLARHLDVDPVLLRVAFVVLVFFGGSGILLYVAGWLLLPEDLVTPVDALASNVALCPPALAQHAGVAAFSPEGYAAAHENVARYAQSRALLLDRLPELGWDRVAPADGAFYLYADISASGLDSVTWCERLLAEAGVALTPGTDFDGVDGRDWVRLSFASSVDVVREAVDRGMSTDDAVAHGIKTTASVVSSAAIVMVAVFGIFAVLSSIIFKEIGVGLAVAILIDATIVRGVLLPATMKLLGDRNWYLPKKLGWLPKLHHEPEVTPAVA